MRPEVVMFIREVQQQSKESVLSELLDDRYILQVRTFSGDGTGIFICVRNYPFTGVLSALAIQGTQNKGYEQ